MAEKRLKENLIRKAKLKKQYAKVLKREGMDIADSGVFANKSLPTAKASQSDKATTYDNTFTEFELEETEEDATPASSNKMIQNARKQGRPVRTSGFKQATEKALAVKGEKAQERRNYEQMVKDIELKGKKRIEIQKRELSKTKRGQPKMNDRIKNILDKLQAT